MTINEQNIIGGEFEDNLVIMKHGSIEKLLRSDNYEDIFTYLSNKMKRYRSEDNPSIDSITKLVAYYCLTLNQPVLKAPAWFIEEFKATKEYLRKYLAM